MEEISAILKALEIVRNVVPFSLHLIHQSNPCKKQIYYKRCINLKLNQMAVTIVACVSDMISFAEQINIALDIWYVAIEIWNTLFSIYIKKEDEKQLTFT